jgi:hypothetical protein
VQAKRDRANPSAALEEQWTYDTQEASGGHMGSVAAAPFGIGTFGIQPVVQPAFLQPLAPQATGAYGLGGAQLVAHTGQLLQVVGQQLQQVQLLQQQQLVQLQQIQQLIQTRPQYVQQQWQPFGTAIGNPFALTIAPQPIASQPAGHVM